jgi:hypothetical protein
MVNAQRPRKGFSEPCERELKLMSESAAKNRRVTRLGLGSDDGIEGFKRGGHEKSFAGLRKVSMTLGGDL